MSGVRVVMNLFGEEMRRGGAPEPLGGGALAFHRSLPGYEPTPLKTLPALAHRFGIGKLLVKDEARRFGLNAFKSLGASYAVFRWLGLRSEATRGYGVSPAEFISGKLRDILGDVTFATATDGNHGRAVAWTAKLAGFDAVIFMPEGSATARIEAIKALGADVRIVPGGYDAAVRTAAAEAEKRGWQVISDTSYAGYTDIPGWIQEGYYTLMQEITEELEKRGEATPDVMVVQAGVGALAAAVGAYRGWNGSAPMLISVEPTGAACMLESAAAADGKPHTATGSGRTIMAGLNCPTPSIIAWPVIKSSYDAFVAVDDRWAEEAMRLLAFPKSGDPAVTAGESGAAGLAAIAAVMSETADADVRKQLRLTSNASVLVINTEGATDPEGYARIIGKRL